MTCIPIAGLLLASVTTAEAQRTGTRLDRNRGAVGSISKLDQRSAVIAANMFSQCVAQREGKLMRKALDLPFTSSEQSKAMAETRDRWDGCLGTSAEFDTLRLTAVLQAGGAAEWFVRTELKSVDLNSLTGMSDESVEATAYRPRTVLEDLGLCILRRSPDRARALMNTDVASTDESGAIKSMMPDVGPCVTQGTELKLNIPNLRAVVAYALYRASSKLADANA